MAVPQPLEDRSRRRVDRQQGGGQQLDRGADEARWAGVEAALGEVPPGAVLGQPRHPDNLSNLWGLRIERGSSSGG
jgi:hypothetical protein